MSKNKKIELLKGVFFLIIILLLAIYWVFALHTECILG